MDVTLPESRWRGWLLTSAIVLACTRAQIAALGVDVPAVLLVLLALAFCCIGAQLPRVGGTKVAGALILCGTLMAAVAAADPMSARAWAVLVIAAVLLLPRMLQVPAYRRSAWIGLVAATVLNAAAVVGQSFGVSAFVRAAPDAKLHGLNDYYLQSAYYAALGAIVLFLALVGKFSVIRSVRGLWTCVGLVVCVYAVLLSGSRGAALMAASGAAAGCLVLLRGGAMRGGRAGIVAVLGAGLLLTTHALDPLLERMNASPEYRLRDEARRSSFQDLAAHVVAHHPFGSGWNGFSVASSETFGVPTRSTHSLFLSIPLDAGWIGALGFALLAALVLVRRLPVQSSAQGTSEAAVLVGLLIAFLAHGVNDSIHVALPAVFLHLVVLYLGAERSIAPPPSSVPGPRPAGTRRLAGAGQR